MKERPIAIITLLHGEQVLIDADQSERLRKHRWYLNGGYAYTRINGRIVAMHVLLANPGRGMHTDHINRNKLDNRLENLRVVQPGVNIRNRRSYRGEGNPFFGKTHSQKFRAMNSERWAKAVLQIGPRGEIIARYRSILDAECVTGISNGNISSVCSGHRSTAGGFRWKYEKDQ